MASDPYAGVDDFPETFLAPLDGEDWTFATVVTSLLWKIVDRTFYLKARVTENVAALAAVLAGPTTFAGAITAPDYKVPANNYAASSRHPIVDRSDNSPHLFGLLLIPDAIADQRLEIPNGTQFNFIRVWVDPVNATPPAGTKWGVTVTKTPVATGVGTVLVTANDTTAGTGYGANHFFDVTIPGTEIIDNISFTYTATISGETGTGKANVFVGGTVVDFRVSDFFLTVGS